MHDPTFNFEVPIVFFEKAGTVGRSRRIAGIISSEKRDQQGETVLQRGLDFDYFQHRGWFNDNHSRKLEDVVGYPDGIQRFEKGAKLPNGDTADSNLTWAEGYLLDTVKGNAFWELGNALQKTDRRIGFSIEGSIEKRIGLDRKTIAKAKVKHVAITHVPVNTDSRLEVLAKSLADIESGEDIEKTLTSGATSNVIPRGEPVTGEGAGQLLSPKSIEGVTTPSPFKKKKKKLDPFAKALSFDQALDLLANRGIDRATSKRILKLAATLPKHGRT